MPCICGKVGSGNSCIQALIHIGLLLPVYGDILVTTMSAKKAVIMGAGPAGLGAAITLARRGLKVTVLEKESQVGLHRRGETIRFHQGMEDLLYPGFFEEQTIHRINERTYYSHTGKKKADRKISTWNLIIEYPRFVQTLADIALRAGVEILFSTAVDRTQKHEGKVRAVIAAGKEYEADLFIASAGHKDPTTDGRTRAERRMDIPIRKYLVKNYRDRDTHLEYFFHVDETYPAIGAIFPRGNQEAEVLLMFLTDSAAKPPKPVDLTRVAEICDRFAEIHPVFGDKIRGSESYYETNTLIPMGDIGSEVLPLPNLILVGDAVGQVEARGGSGIRSSFMMGHISAEAAVETLLRDKFSQQSQGAFRKRVLGSEQMHELKDLNLKFGLPRRAFFSTVTNPSAMDFFWFGLEFFMR
jgi:flavin-dependent dehydrogenase